MKDDRNLTVGRLIRRALSVCVGAALAGCCWRHEAPKGNANTAKADATPAPVAALNQAPAKAEAPRMKLETAEFEKLFKNPVFPDRDFNITDYGAKVGGKADALPAITQAIAACTAAGGGRVMIPSGDWLAKGPIHLKSNVNLHLQKGATVRFSTDPADYPTVYTRFEGTEVMNHSPLLYAWEQENIGITGAGVFDGQGSFDNWWKWTLPDGGARADIESLRQMGDDGVPVAERKFGLGKHLRPNFVQPYRCKNVLIEGVTFKDSPMWFLHPTLCENVIVRDVKTHGHGPNNDGCDPESCKNVLMEGCDFDNGDDCIAIKSGRDNDGRRVNVPTENVLIRECNMRDGHSGVGIGSEISGGVRNVLAEDNDMDSPNLERALRIKSNSWRGGFVENVLFRNNRVGQVKETIFLIEMFYGGQTGPNYPRIENITMEKVSVQQAPRAFSFTGVPELPINGITVRDCNFQNIQLPDILTNVENFSCYNVRIAPAPRQGSATQGQPAERSGERGTRPAAAGSGAGPRASGRRAPAVQTAIPAERAPAAR